MGLRAVLMGGLLGVLVGCSVGEKPRGPGDPGTVATGGAGTEGGSGGTSQGGASSGGGGSSGVGNGGSSGDGTTGGGGQDPDGGTVTGVVRTEMGSPNDGVLVVVGSEFTYTDSEGRFEIPEVPPEYDLALIVPTAPHPYILVVRGISERTVSLRAPGDDLLGTSNVTGVVTGGTGVPIPDDRNASAMFQDPAGQAIAFPPGFLVGPDVPLGPSDASYTMSVTWPGIENLAGFLYALEYRVDEAHVPISYDGFGSTPLELRDQSTLGMDDGSTPATTIPLARLESRTVTGRVTVPSGFGSRLEFSVGPFPVVGPSVVDDSYSMVLPTGLERARNTVLLTAEIGDGPDFANSMAVFPIDDSVTTLDLSVVAPAELSLPEEGVADVDYDTQFSWDPPANSMSILALDLDGWYVRIVTDDSSATIPDLSMWVMHRPGTRTEWWVENDIGTSVDEWVNDGMFDVTVPKTTSFSRTFTLAK